MSTIDFFSKLSDEYFAWFRDKTTMSSIGTQWVEITTPFLDRHNDHLQIYACRNGNTITLTDDGYTISDLKMSGFDFDTPKRNAVLQEVLAGFSVSIVENRLEVTGRANNFPRYKHNLIQAMLAVDDLFYMATPHVDRAFRKQTADWLEGFGVRFSRDVSLEGKSGLSHKFCGIIPQSKDCPERVLRTVFNPNPNSCRQFLFEWLDISDRRPQSTLIVFLNDLEKTVQENVLVACQSYEGVTGILWSKRDEHRNFLAG
jgi:hypothetical protein